MKINRNNFLPEKSIKKGDKTTLILPIDFVFLNTYYQTELCIIGITESGHKCSIRVLEYPIFTDILLDNDKLYNNLLDNKYEFEKITMLPGKEFSEPKTYARVYFKKITARSQFIKKYTEYGYTLANDDSKYEYLLYRYTGISTCGWNIITDFQFTSEYNNNTSGRKIPFEDPNKLPVQIVVKNITQIKPAEKQPERDNSIICAFDLETFTPYKYGGVPLPKNPNDSIKMCAISFRFYWDTSAFLWILLTQVPISEEYIALKAPDVKQIKVIQTNNIPDTFGDILGAMQPDFISGYNCGDYDWPFIKSRLSDEVRFLNTVSPLNLSDFNKGAYGCMSHNKQFNKPRSIKIDAENMAIYNGYIYPGCVCFDTMIVMRRRDKTETSWSLNTFLKKHGLSEKFDMPYDKMAKIFRLWEVTTPDKITDLESVLFPNDTIVDQNAINNLTGAEIIDLFNQTNNVGLYCLKDAEAVQNLLFKLCVIQDIREVGNLSYTTTRDGFYKADGMKVSNCLLHDSHKAEWGIWDIKYPLAFTLYKVYVYTNKYAAKEEKYKFIGGHVLQPIKGIYGKTAIEKLGIAITDPRDKEFDNSVILEIQKFKIYSDRPGTGLDFQSLYPSLIMCYNFSPEYYVANKTIFINDYTEKLAKININAEALNILEINTMYKRESDLKCDKLYKKGYFIQHTATKTGNSWEYKNHGIFPTILKRLFNMRRKIKADMGIWATILEKLARDVKPVVTSGVITLECVVDILNKKIQNIKDYSANFSGQKLQLEINKIKNYESSIKLISEKWQEFGSYSVLYNTALFKYNYYNTKQNAVKVFMNTFYGEMGNPNSAFFIVQMSGGVTKMGRKALKTVQAYLTQKEYNIYYGDTDSLYISPPHIVFENVDNKYYTGQLSKEQYYEEMVGITMNNLREISVEVADMLEQKTGNPFLKMEYEEVLFPFGFVGKKNYFGIKHINSIDFSLCKLDYTKEEHRELFKKELFARGLPLRRRDGSPFTKKLLLELLMQFCSLYENKPYDKIIYTKIENTLDSVAKNGSDFYKLLLKNYSFREPRENSHTVQMSYRKRMIEYYLHEQINKAYYYIKQGDISGVDLLNKIYIENTYDEVFSKMQMFYNLPDRQLLQSGLSTIQQHISNYKVNTDLLKLNFKIPAYGSRINLLVLNKPNNITAKGTKKQFSTGDALDEEQFINNYYYKQFLIYLYKKQGVEIINDTDIMTPSFKVYFSEFFGKVARFMLYLPEYKQAIDIKCKDLAENEFENKYKKCTYKEEFDNPEVLEKCKKYILKNSNKAAESFIAKKIKSDLEKKYKNYFPDITCNAEKLKQEYKVNRKNLLQNIGTGFLINMIIDFITTDCGLKSIQNKILKYLEQKFITEIYIDLNNLPGYVFKDMTYIQRKTMEYKSKFISNLQNLCLSLQQVKLSDMSGFSNDIKALNAEFKLLVKRVVLEKEIMRAIKLSKVQIKNTNTEFKQIINLDIMCDQDLEFLNFLNN